ncbi:MAG: transcription antitermination factor NusB [Eubacterium sp.]|nr:transcription antitermination factor NusB [Eubacterium sp.]
MNKRREARETLMQAVFQMDMQKDESSELLESLIATKKLNDSQRTFIRSSFETIRRNLEAIDEAIEKNATNWTISRMPKTDLAVLRVAVSEILFQDSIPDAVAINEAVEISKIYCSDESRKFINGLLGKVAGSK